jgi:hypothetical protein
MIDCPPAAILLQIMLYAVHHSKRRPLKELELQGLCKLFLEHVCIYQYDNGLRLIPLWALREYAQFLNHIKVTIDIVKNVWYEQKDGHFIVPIFKIDWTGVDPTKPHPEKTPEKRLTVVLEQWFAEINKLTPISSQPNPIYSQPPPLQDADE